MGSRIKVSNQVMVRNQERRKLTRLRLEVLLRILLPGAAQAAHAETRNLSARGIFFHTRAHVEPGQNLECVLILPEKLTLASAPMLVGCKGRVVRVNRDLPGHTIGVAVEISSYDFSWNGELLQTAGPAWERRHEAAADS